MDVVGVMTATGWVGVTVAAAAWALAGRTRRWRRTLLAAVAVLCGAAGAFGLWYRYRPWPTVLDHQVAPGIRVRRYAVDQPRALVLSVSEIDLTAAGVEVVTTPTAPDGKVSARTVGGFAEAHALHVAINAHFFDPFHTATPWDYYPKAGDPVWPLGIAADDGTVARGEPWRGEVAWFSREPRLQIGGEAPAAIWDAVAGRNRLVDAGRNVAPTGGSLAPRVALGVDATGTQVTLVVVDGRQRAYSGGLTLRELGDRLVDMGIHDALELDGGGSATMVTGGPAGVETINCPIHTRIPGRQRPVATHLGFRVQ